MAEDKRQTTDPAQINRVIETLFCNFPIQLKDGAKTSMATIQNYSQDHLEIIAPDSSTTRRILTLTHKDHSFILECEIKQKTEYGTEVLLPRRLHIHKIQRKDERVTVEDESNKPDSYITNCIPVKSIPDGMGAINTKRDSITALYRSALKEALPTANYANIVLRKSQRQDTRMRLMQQFSLPIFAPHRTEPGTWSHPRINDVVPFNNYRTSLPMTSKDDRFDSEICIPLWYGKIYMYAYLHLFSRGHFTPEEFMMVERFALKFRKDFEYYGIPRNEAVCPIDDISMSGAGFLHPPNETFHKSFMPGESLIFSIQFKPLYRMEFSGIIRQIRSEERAYRFGVQFTEMTPGQTEALTEFLAKR